ncbi:PEP-CTERM sorting domain-containing protein [Paludibacterium yongneupense]|uniref:PEP-CTERM sorting domain-containing protein n=1 Tax=Paludibacterium yongneupense TaxID=400061 RepID=UPI00040A9AD3|nr:PEP-CTERM sorting domain-containing protein [Paludibacterium yongneupense]
MKLISSILGMLLAMSLQARADVITLNPVITFGGFNFVTAPAITIDLPSRSMWNPDALSVVFQAAHESPGLTSLSFSITSLDGETAYDMGAFATSGGYVYGKQTYVVPAGSSQTLLGGGSYQLLLYGQTSDPNLEGTLTTSLTPAVPEPESYALLGLGLTALIMRRRGVRRATVPA